MVTRSSSVVVMASCLAIGLGIGFSLGRGGRVATAQVGNADRTQAQEVSTRRDPAAPRTDRVRKDGAEVYEQISREYEQFRHVDRMFELVSKAVTPSVVHI